MRLRSGKRTRYTPGPGFTRRTRFRGASSMSSSRAAPRHPAGTRSGAGVTVQHDARRIYQKKRMPRFRRKRWKAFSRKVAAVGERDLGSRSVVFNRTQQFFNQTTDNHNLAYIALYSAFGVDSWMADINNLSGLENPGNPTAAAGTTVQDTTKWIFKSAILDITVRNTSGIITVVSVGNAAPTYVLDSTAKLEVDVYELISGREWSTIDGTQSDITSIFSKGSSSTLNIGGAGTGIDLSFRGVTPWDLPYALSYWRLKILRKTKYFVNNGDTFTYQVRDPKRRVITQERMEKTAGGNKPGWTRHIMIISKLVPGNTVGPLVGNYVESMHIGMTRKYFYKIEGASEDRDRMLKNT